MKKPSPGPVLPPRPPPAIPKLSVGYEMYDAALDARIAAIAEDVRSKKDQYRGIDPHELAELLGIDTSRHPDRDWDFIRFQRRVPFEEIVSVGDGPLWMYRLKECVDFARYAEIEAEADAVYDEKKELNSEFLTAPEKRTIEQWWMQEKLSDGGTLLAFFNVRASNGDILKFEAFIEDDGGCIELKTPYDERDGLFTNLDDGVCD
jgi:hypothetical protein